MASRVGLIRQLAVKYGLDPDAVLAIASHEGASALMGGNSIGDHGTSFGPFQLHAGGALPRGKGNAWANSPAGIEYAIRHMAPYARGLQGEAAIQAISAGFERPADVTAEVRDAVAHYGKITGGPLNAAWGNHSGSGARIGGKAGQGQSGLPPAKGLTFDAFKSMASAELLQQSAATAAGAPPDSSGLIALALARKQVGAAQQTFGPTPTKAPLVGPGLKGGGGRIQFLGNTGHENPQFMGALSAAASAAGATKVRIISGYRSPEHNAAVGGAPHSLHTRGLALDGEAFIPGRGWVPLGQALLPVAGKFGIRSGDQAGFFHGAPDPNHVDFAPHITA